MTPTNRLLTATEAADMLACSADTVRAMWNSGELPAISGIGRGRRITLHQLLAFIESLETDHVA